jgi:adenosylmethionine-8-amino-7-oxononanoate aminotransferase
MEGTAVDLVEKDLRYIWHPCSQMKDYEELRPIVIERGRGVYLYDRDGKEYLDIISSWWCNLLGHCIPGSTRPSANSSTLWST